MKLFQRIKSAVAKRRGTILVEYILLLTIVGIGAIVGLAVLRNALNAELNDLSEAVMNINS